MKESHRGQYWRDVKERDIYRNPTQALVQLNFKWSPCSIKNDFEALSKQSKMPLRQIRRPLMDSNKKMNDYMFDSKLPKMMINHFEFHKEITRKDDLLCNLKTQL